MKMKALIVDDNEELLMGLKMFLTPHVGDVTTLKNPNQLPSFLQNNNFDLVLLDMNFTAGVNSGNEGLYWMKRVLELDPTATIVLITGFGDVELAVKAMREGAVDFIQKGPELQRTEEHLIPDIL